MKHIIYPTFKIRGHPTPNEKLWVCDACGKAAWGPHGQPVSQHDCGGHMRRYREATPAEYEEGRKALREIL